MSFYKHFSQLNFFAWAEGGQLPRESPTLAMCHTSTITPPFSAMPANTNQAPDLTTSLCFFSFFEIIYIFFIFPFYFLFCFPKDLRKIYIFLYLILTTELIFSKRKGAY